ncbi:MAG: hypothetical protein H7A35_11220 [Planctomycetales bacterium]|nr:hypothetical protein [bacterium]UNM07433.1 MAG: hypothetical protein H7A35_11220 [Planctomycetales bacterium]
MLLTGVVIPGIVALALALFFWPARKPGRKPGRLPHWMGGVVLAVTFLTGWILTRGWPDWPVRESAAWLPWLAVGGAVLGWLVAHQRLPGPTVAMLRMLVSVVTIWATTQSLQTHTWQKAAWLWIIGLALVLFAAWSIWESVLAKRQGVLPPLLLTGFFSCLAIMALLGRTATVSQTTGILCAGLGAFFVVSLVRRDLDLSQSTLFVAMPLLAGLVVNAHFYAYMDVLQTMLLMACCLAVLLAVRFTPEEPQFAGLLLALLITVLPALGGIAWDLLNSNVQTSSSEEEDPYAEYF